MPDELFRSAETVGVEAVASAETGVGFALSNERKKGELSRVDLERYSELYGKGGRQIRRWWKEGAPLDRPAEMPGWWARGHTWGCPDEILRAAAAVKTLTPAVVETPAVVASTVPVPTLLGPGLDIGDFALSQDEDVRQAEGLVAVAWHSLEAAYKGGAVNVDSLHRRHEKAMETLRKARTAARAELIARGKYIAREVVDSDRAMAAELLRQMRESMVRRVRELCPSVPKEMMTQVASAIERVRKHEERVLCDPVYLREVKSEDDLTRLLDAA